MGTELQDTDTPGEDIRPGDVSEQDRIAGDQAADDAFAAAFADGAAKPDPDVITSQQHVETKDKPAASTPAAPAPAASTPPAAPPEDPYKDLSPALRDVVARAMLTENDLKAMKARVGPTQRENEDLKKRLAALEARANAPAAPAPVAKQRLAEVDRVAGELPEVADAIEARAAGLEARIDALTKPPSPVPIAAPAPTSDGDDSETQRQSALLASVHPDWATHMNSTDYKLWVSSQGDDYRQRMFNTNSAAEVSGALTKFKAHQAQAQQLANATAQEAARRNRRTSAAVSPGGGNVRPADRAAAQSAEEAFAKAFNAP